MSTAFAWFQRELDAMMPNRELRLVRDPHRLGLDLWVIERKKPAAFHAAELEALRLEGIERFRSRVSETLGQIKYDLAPEWGLVHICRTETCTHNPPDMADHDPECYREPNRFDLRALWMWLNEFKTPEESQRVLREEADAKAAKVITDGDEAFVKAVKSSYDFRALQFYDAPKTEFKESPSVEVPAEDAFRKEGTLWVPA